MGGVLQGRAGQAGQGCWGDTCAPWAGLFSCALFFVFAFWHQGYSQGINIDSQPVLAHNTTVGVVNTVNTGLARALLESVHSASRHKILNSCYSDRTAALH